MPRFYKLTIGSIPDLFGGSLSLTPGDGQILVDFGLPPSGGMPPYTYELYRSDSGCALGELISDDIEIPYLDEDVENGIEYNYILRTVDSVATSIYTACYPATPEGENVLTLEAAPGPIILIPKAAGLTKQSGSEPAPDIFEIFDYSNTSNFLSNPNGWYNTNEDINTGQMVIDDSVLYNGHKTLKYTFPQNATEHTISRTIDLPPNVTELWVEVAAKFDPSFTMLYGGAWPGSTVTGYKFLHIGVPEGRFGNDFEHGPEGYLSYDAPAVDFEAMHGVGYDTVDILDNEWHIFRRYVKLNTSTNASHTMWVDGVPAGEGMLTGSLNHSISGLGGVSLGRNLNFTPPAPAVVWRGDVKIWLNSNNPGWVLP